MCPCQVRQAIPTGRERITGLNTIHHSATFESVLWSGSSCPRLEKEPCLGTFASRRTMACRTPGGKSPTIFSSCHAPKCACVLRSLRSAASTTDGLAGSWKATSRIDARLAVSRSPGTAPRMLTGTIHAAPSRPGARRPRQLSASAHRSHAFRETPRLRAMARSERVSAAENSVHANAASVDALDLAAVGCHERGRTGRRQSNRRADIHLASAEGRSVGASCGMASSVRSFVRRR